MKYGSKQSGFSLVETLVAITILLIVIVGPLTIVSTTSKSTSFSNEQVVAFYLAQEGAELAQKARDDLVLDGFAGTNPTPWADFTDDSGGTYEDCFSTGCGLEVDEDAVGSVIVASDCCDLYYDDSGPATRARYTHDSTLGPDNQTIYSRVITFTNVTAFEVQVVSTVEWDSGLTRDAQSVEVITYLFDVYGN